ncbi:MAG: MFS transporter, partial [Pseudomonadota bacterium]
MQIYVFPDSRLLTLVVIGFYSATMSLIPLYLVNFINALGFSIVIPYLVFWAIDFGGSEALYGFLGATYAGFQLIGAPLLGSASDRYGRRKMLLLSQFGTLVSWFVILGALASPVILLTTFSSEAFGTVELTLPLLLLILARASDGITAGNISIANAYLSDVSSAEERSKNFGRMSAASSLGFILGPGIAGVMGKDVYAVYLAIAISLVGLFCIWFFLKESLAKPISQNPCGSETKRQLGAELKDCNDRESHSLRDLLHRKTLLHLFVLYFVIYLGFNIFYSTFPLMAKTVLNWTPTQLGYFFSAMGGCLVVVQSFVLPRMGVFFKEWQLLVLGAALLASA